MRKVPSIFAVGMVVWGSVAVAQPNSEAAKLERNTAWLNCLKTKSVELSKGSDAATVVAEGVELSCGKELQAIIDPMRSADLRDEAKWVAFKNQMTVTLGEAGRKIALQEILKARAERGTK